jgi:PilZ domain
MVASYFGALQGSKIMVNFLRMATQSNVLQTSAFSAMKTPATDERRSEPRFGAEGEVAVLVREGGQERELLAKLMDFSLHGLRVQLATEITEGTEVHVFFSWGEVATVVMWSAPIPNGFEIGLQLF